MKVFVSGGAGYIGSHTCVELMSNNHEVLVFDNFSNASPVVLDRIKSISGRGIKAVHGDVRNLRELNAIFAEFRPEAVIHFAALKSVAESLAKPLDYFDNNINGSIVLLQAMKVAEVDNLVFSSSATVYGAHNTCPIREDAVLQVTNPYGRTKLVTEQLIEDVAAGREKFEYVNLRYFNPAGAHESGELGEDPSGVPSNLIPYISQVAVGRRPHLEIFGNDYATLDGTGVRDYIHVVDLARSHVAAVNFLSQRRGSLTVNVGTGRGYSVLEVVTAFERACGRKIPLRFSERRAGDVAECYADPSLAQRTLDWRAEYDLERICADAWRWQSRHPYGYRDI